MRKHVSTLIEFNSAPNLIISKADKSGQTVLLNKSDCKFQIETAKFGSLYYSKQRPPLSDHFKDQ